ncbi:unnamed protein product [Adineta steineri]|uniref:Phospholipid scramblase n=1 Tax=Adineta steineri TaxID=433720 RepID=A0A814FW00_9BILA|nr:unnamed protein product [Adineta steineri]
MSVKKDEASNNYQITPILSSPLNGLDCLRSIDSLYISQQVSWTEVMCGIASEAKFDIFNDKRERLFQAIETSTFWQRLFCTTRRSFTLRILDNNNQDIIILKREFKCCSGCCWCANMQCCSQELIAESPPGTFIGTVSQEGSCWRSMFKIKDAGDNHVLTVQGPLMTCDIPCTRCCENKFALLGTDGITEIGAIYKKYRGYFQEALTSADAFLLKVPMDLDVKIKAMSLAALFLIEYMIFSAVPEKN